MSMVVNCYVSALYSVGSGGLEKEKEFVQKCMESLSAASSQLDQVLATHIPLCFVRLLVSVV